MADQPDYDKILKDLENAIEVMRNNRDTPVRAIPIIISTIKLVDLIGNMGLSDYERTFVAAVIFCSLAELAQQQAKIKEN